MKNHLRFWAIVCYRVISAEPGCNILYGPNCCSYLISYWNQVATTVVITQSGVVNIPQFRQLDRCGKTFRGGN